MTPWDEDHARLVFEATEVFVTIRLLLAALFEMLVFHSVGLAYLCGLTAGVAFIIAGASWTLDNILPRAANSVTSSRAPGAGKGDR